MRYFRYAHTQPVGLVIPLPNSWNYRRERSPATMRLMRRFLKGAPDSVEFKMLVAFGLFLLVAMAAMAASLAVR